jgi:DNA-directed RNA polymerase subunit RPC12/RpoP
MQISHQITRYVCSNCGILLKETQELIADNFQVNEECPECGSLLSKTLKSEWKSHEKLNNNIQTPVKFQIAFEEHTYRLTFDIEKIDSSLSLTTGESLCIIGIGKKDYTDMLLSRLCIDVLISKKQGGFDSPSVVIVDAGNSLDFYQYVNFARQYGLDIKRVLQRIVISRSFTIYQLANTIIYELPKIIEKYNAKMIIVSDLLSMFLNDPQVQVREVEDIIKEIITSIKRNNEILSVVSCNHKSQYNKILFSRFDKIIEIAKEEQPCKANSQLLNIKVKNNKNSLEYNKNRILLLEKQLRTIQQANFKC